MLEWSSDEVYPSAMRIRLVQDQLNTHRPASLYKAFAPAEAKWLLLVRQLLAWTPP
ncbi:MAG: hypothetical protein AAF827_03320 [Cyanobacteria bacterium P01_D01_bin.6]